MNERHLTLEEAQDQLTRRLRDGARVLLIGASGAGKTTLMRTLASALHTTAHALTALTTDPGRPAFGVPGALARGRWDGATWRPEQIEGLATLDVARHRMTLVAATARLLHHHDPQRLIVDAPGILRGSAAHDLVTGLAHITRADLCVALLRPRDDADHPLFRTARGLGVPVWFVGASPKARKLADGARTTARTEAWSRLCPHDTPITRLPLDRVALHTETFAPDDANAWRGRQIALLDARGHTVGMGIARALLGDTLEAQWCALPTAREGVDHATITRVIARDAELTDGERPRLQTVREETSPRLDTSASRPAPTRGPFTPREKPEIHVSLGTGPAVAGGSIRALFPGGLFDDPMVVLRLDHRQRCLFLDAGEVAKVPTRIVHQATDLFLSHAHLDHLGDFPWLLRRRAGMETACRVYGPPGIARRVANMVHAFTWDRVEDRGPRFEVAEIDERGDGSGTMRWWHIQAGYETGDWADGMVLLREEPLREGVIMDEPRLIVRTTTLDHGGIPTMAYSIEEPTSYQVRGNLLRERGWAPGPWLGTLKYLAATRQRDAVVEIPAGDATLTLDVASLEDELLIPRPGQKIVYATDLADSPENHARLVPFARDAHLLICESSFLEEDVEQAERTGHLTARACATIARDANVGRLVAFHHSVRYEDRPEQMYRELLAIFDRVHVPAAIRARMMSTT